MPNTSYHTYNVRTYDVICDLGRTLFFIKLLSLTDDDYIWPEHLLYAFIRRVDQELNLP